MELTFSELKKRDVINVVDGKSLGRVSDLRLRFPEGRLTGIYVPGRKASFFSRIFDKSTVYIDESRIVKIGGDVILVNLKCSDNCTEPKKHPSVCPPPPCPPPRPPRHEHRPREMGEEPDLSALSGGGDRIDIDDY